MLYINLIVYGGGVLISIIGIICMIKVTSLVENIRGTLISFSVANLFGTGFLFFYTVVTNYNFGMKIHEFRLFVGLICSLTLSLSHLVCMVLAEYILISSRFRRASASFKGFLFISWVVCVSACSNLIFVTEETQAIVFFTLIIFSFFAFVIFYITVMKFHRNRACYISAIRKSYLRGNTPSRYKDGEILFPRIIVASYFACVLPFAIRGIFDYIATGSFADNSWDFIFLIVFSLNFYFVGFVCIYLRLRKY